LLTAERVAFLRTLIVSLNTAAPSHWPSRTLYGNFVVQSFIDEFAQANTAMQQASSLTSLNGKPLIVLTADKGINDDQWQAKAGPHGHIVDQQSPPSRQRHPRIAY
jgi:hypothetical protein